MSRQEKLIIIFLLITAMIGLAVSYYKKLPSDITIVASNIKKEPTTNILSTHHININTADRKTLMLLPGIGPSLAERIIVYRRENGPFLSSDHIIKVSGIGGAKFDGIKDFIITDDEPR